MAFSFWNLEIFFLKNVRIVRQTHVPFVMIEIYQMLGGGNMYRTLKTPFRASHTTIQQLFDIRRLSGTIWNDCVELARYYYRLGNKWITQTELQKELKRLYPLHSQTIQAVAHKFLAAREGQKRQGKRVTKNPISLET